LFRKYFKPRIPVRAESASLPRISADNTTHPDLDVPRLVRMNHQKEPVVGQSVLFIRLIYINAANQPSRFLEKTLIVKGFYLK
jgi:hypothetical protein